MLGSLKIVQHSQILCVITESEDIFKINNETKTNKINKALNVGENTEPDSEPDCVTNLRSLISPLLSLHRGTVLQECHRVRQRVRLR